ncbi:lantibiotic dehydratase [Nocardia jiangxiensis]|uniref:lantibiotic dehydratase n=1 Tax=Nocardia jiangxiensis TaxID=282685 RepID=UPI000592B9E6|nr:lantibiotic dehydratase [Nocardia jiangxiensis]
MSADERPVPESLGELAALRCSIGAVDRYPDFPAEWGDTKAIGELWSDATLREAVLLASPVLAAQTVRVLDSGESGTALKKRRRIHKGLLKYALRLSSRCTPFGTFAGMTMLPLGDREPVLATEHRRLVFASRALGRRLAESVRGGPSAGLVANPAVLERGGRYVVAVMRGSVSAHDVASVRATGPVTLARQFAGTPRPRRDVEDRIATRYPDVPRATVEKLVTQLIDAEVLLSTADASFFDVDVLDRLPGSARVTEIREAIGRYASVTPAQDTDALRTLLDLCRSEGDVQQDLRVDVELAVQGEIPARCAEDAAKAARVLARTALFGSRDITLNEFCEEFQERYGYTLVPLMRVVDEELGIGFPRAYDDPGSVPRRIPSPDERTQRELRGRLLDRARRAGADTVVITDDDLRELPEPDRLASGYDIFLRLHRDSAGPTSTVVGANFPGGTAVGRFTPGIAVADVHARRCAAWESRWWAEGGSGVVADIDYACSRDGVNEVAATGRFFPTTLVVNSDPTGSVGNTLRLADVHLGLVGDRVRLFLADGTPLRCQQLNMVAVETSAKVVRLLRDISNDGIVRPYWGWGDLEDSLHYFPEVRYGGVVIAERRWRCPESVRAETDSVAAWLSESGVGRYVLVGEMDNRLHLDTRHALHLDLLVEEIAKGHRWIHDAPDPDGLGVVRDDARRRHATEVVVTVPSPTKAMKSQRAVQYPIFDTRSDAERLLAPGGEWSYVTVRVAPTLNDRVLADFRAAVPELDGQWYFVRYRENAAGQLRLRIHRPLSELDRALEWLTEARLSGAIGEFCLPIHHRELERYGGVASLPSYEQLFCRETGVILPMLPVMGEPSSGERVGVRDGIERAAGVLSGWLNGIAREEEMLRTTVDLAVNGYLDELAEAAHRIKKDLRGRTVARDAASARMESTVREFWAAPPVGAVRTPEIVQSAGHLMCNRLGLTRAEEFAAMWLINNEITTKGWRNDAGR